MRFQFAKTRRSVTFAAIASVIASTLHPDFATGGVPTSPYIHLDWDGCTASATTNRDFACNTDVGEDVLVASFTGPTTALEGTPTWFQFTVWFESGNAQPPSWWQVYPGGCRASALLVDELPPATNTCLHFPASFFGVNRGALGDGAQLWGVIQLAQPNPPEAVIPGETYFLFNMRLQHTRTAGADSCSGCGTPMYIFFRQLEVITTANPVGYVFDGFVTPKATWQVPVQVPTRNTTWGRIKSQYR